MKVILYMLIYLVSLTTVGQEKNTLTIDFTSERYKQGKVYVAVYNTSDSFLKKPVTGAIVDLKDGRAQAVIKDLPEGEYAASAFYDKNNNGKLDTNFLGIPKEPTAMSNDAKARFGPPKYKDAKFDLSNNTTIEIKF